MAQINDLQCIGDALFQSDVKANGKLNNEILDVDDNCLIIDVCRRLDLSAVGNKIEIELPDGYVGVASTYGGQGYIGWNTFGTSSASWTTNAQVKISYLNPIDSSVVSQPNNEIPHYNQGNFGLNPFMKGYLKIEVTTAAVGDDKYVMIFFRLYCRKV